MPILPIQNTPAGAVKTSPRVVEHRLIKHIPFHVLPPGQRAERVVYDVDLIRDGKPPYPLAQGVSEDEAYHHVCGIMNGLALARGEAPGEPR